MNKDRPILSQLIWATVIVLCCFAFVSCTIFAKPDNFNAVMRYISP